MQEIILQNFISNEGSRLSSVPEAPALEEYLELIEHWRRVAPGVAIQIPPNINPHWEVLLPWTDDLGGISTDGDWVNPQSLGASRTVRPGLSASGSRTAPPVAGV